MRVVLHGFGSFPVVFWHLIRQARAEGVPAEWAIILTSDHYEKFFRDLLGVDRVIVLSQVGGQPRPGEENWVYPGYIFRDLASEKRNYKSGPASAQRERGMEIYRQTRRLMEAFRPTHALVSQVEGFDGKAFIAAAKEFGARIAVPTSARNLGGTYFSPNDLEKLPAYARAGADKWTEPAKRYVDEFRLNPRPAARKSTDQSERLDDFSPPLSKRALNALRRWMTVPGGFQPDFLRVSLLNNLPVLRDSLWAARRKRNERFFDIGSLEELPRKFVFYPLQYTPESSINTPAPYFVDQMRAIDAVRFAMPGDCTLVVKEHPSCIILRSSELVRRLQRTSGVSVARSSLPSLDICKKAGATISVTGTATFEAMLSGRNALCLGPNLVSDFLGGVCSIEELPQRLHALFSEDPAPDVAVPAVAALMNARYDAYFSCPGIPGEPVLRRDNIAKLLRAYLDHCRREEEAGC